jgi:hypothetical protein
MAQNESRRLLAAGARALIIGLSVVSVVLVVVMMVGLALVVLFFGLDAALPTGTDISDCHGVDSDYPGAVGYKDTYVLGEPTPATCEDCHTTEISQFNQGRMRNALFEKEGPANIRFACEGCHDGPDDSPF